eukprot:TRINITY_DN2547_c0_g1_i1.p1 TRINITY_DN2547_c0_g1~~TRINITY_DN2547_c0_g1_i1.p1  ORF type:complete len:157 (-),score=37.57 TRINITY_DN2547_c0_g1_i1:421-891(-)
MSKVHVLSKEEISQQTSQLVRKLSQEAIKKHDRFVVAISGASLPSTLCPKLFEETESLQLEKWHIFLADERIVPLDHADSNYREVLKNCPQVVHPRVYPIDVSLIGTEGDSDKIAAAYEKKLKELFPNDELPVFDVVLRGRDQMATLALSFRITNF